MTENSLEEMIGEYRRSNYVCKRMQKYLSKFKSLEDLLENGNAEENAELAYWYTFKVVGERCPKLEEYIKGSPEWMTSYIIITIGERCPDLEVFIKPSPKWTTYYNQQFKCEI